MPKRSSKKKRLDPNQTKLVAVNYEAKEANPTLKAEKNPAAVALGRLGGLKGGPARAQRLTKRQRSQIARNAALARWSKREA